MANGKPFKNVEEYFSKLRRLFASGVVVRHIGGKKLKLIDTDSVQITAPSDKYRRLYTGGYNPPENGMDGGFAVSRLDLYRDYESMDTDPLLSSALDILADECVTQDEYGEILTIKSENQDIKDILSNLFHDILNIEYNLWPWIRSMCKYGDFFLYMDLHPDLGVVGVRPMSPYEVERMEGVNPKNPYEYKFRIGMNAKTLYDSYQIAHFRIISDLNYQPYGRSYLEGARKIWKQLCMLEEAMLIFHIVRAPEKRVFKIDIGNIPENEVDDWMGRVISQTHRVPLVDPNTGEYNLKYNIQNIAEDYFLPVRGGESGTSIEQLAGMEYAAIDFVEYLRKRLMTALKIPAAFLGYEEGIGAKCLHPDTLIPVVGADSMAIKDIARALSKEDAAPIWVYGYDVNNAEIIPVLVKDARKTRKSADLVRVTLENGQRVISTPDHKYVMANGSATEAQHLRPDDDICSASNIQPISANVASYYSYLGIPVASLCMLKVLSVEPIEEKSDTFNLEVDNDNHNFLTTAGVFVKNSTLASQDLNLAKTISRLQKTVLTELYRIAITHLYSQGMTNKDVVNFELELTNPSVIYEEERVALWSSKIELVNNIITNKTLTREWAYTNILGLSGDEIEEQATGLIRDAAFAHRMATMESEGNDPILPSADAQEDMPDDSSEGEMEEDVDTIDNQWDAANGAFTHANADADDDATLADDMDIAGDLRTSHSDYRQRYRGGSPLAVES